MSNLLDLHVYTNNSPGVKDKISFLCETAAEKGFRAVAFTDILDVEANAAFDLKRMVRHSFFDVCKARQLFFDTVSVFAGIELRQAYRQPGTVREILAAQRYDIVLTCLTRYAAGEEFGLSPETPQAAFDAFAARYCELLLQTVRTTDFDVLSRLLAPLRRTSADYAVFEELIKPVLQALAVREKALEIGTKDLLGSEVIRDLYFRLAEYFRQVGGKYITFGSESVSHDELGAGVEQAMYAMKRAGFSCFTFYEGRIPYTVAL